MRDENPENYVRDVLSDPLRQKSRLLSRWVWVAGGVVGLLLLILFFLPQKTDRPAKNDRVDPTAQFIPEDEIKSSYLDTFTKDQGKKKKEPSEQEGPSSSAAPMGIFISDSTGRGLLGIPMGTEIEAVIEQAVIAGDTGTPVIARVVNDFSHEGKTIIPKNSRLFGETDGLVENRLNVRFSRLVLPNGEDYPFSGIALDKEGAGGIEGHIKRKGGKRGLAVLSGAALGAAGVFVPESSGYGDALLRNSYEGARGEAGKDWNYYRTTEAQPVVTLKAHQRIRVMVDRPV